MSVPSRYVQKWAPWSIDAVEERLGLDALAHEPALHVGDGDDERVDPAVADHRLELGQPGVVRRLVLAHPNLSLVGRQYEAGTGACRSLPSWTLWPIRYPS